MVMSRACPGSAVLEQFLLGRLDGADMDRVQEHVQDCTGCALRLEALRADNSLIPTVRASIDSDAAPDVPVPPTPSADVRDRAASPPPAGAAFADVLSPPERPGE